MKEVDYVELWLMRVAKKRNNKSQRTRQFYTHLLRQFNEFSNTTPKQLIEDYRKIDNVFGRDNYLRQISDLVFLPLPSSHV